ncbi:MAG: GDP-L-fucose synthase [Pseudomonadota bacterium]|nr:GDP-L-fucose synthase [Pseudomonadota bacterium]
MNYSLNKKLIWVAGHNGMVGSATVRRLLSEDCEVITVKKNTLDLRDSSSVLKWIKNNKPEVIIVAAGKVGGIHANSHYPAEFLYDNLMIETNIIHSAWQCGIEKLLFLGSSCIYPRNTLQPITEDKLLTGELEPTNEWYALAKIAGIKLCQSYREQYNTDFISVMPSNLYGPGDNFHPENSHVPAALLLRFHNAKTNNEKKSIVWGSGEPKREFLYVDDLADALVYLLQNYSEGSHVNIGTGADISIKDFAYKVKECVGYDGDLIFDRTKPDGMQRKVLDVSKLTQLGWTAKLTLNEGLTKYYEWFKENIDVIRQ